MAEELKIPQKIAAPVFDSAGVKTQAMVELEPKIFSQKPNSDLVGRAVLVSLANQRLGTAKVKTRGEVDLTGKKMYKQKHTGRARHGAASAPIFVGGGVAHGPKPGKRVKVLNEKMRRKALISVLSQKFQGGKVAILERLIWDEISSKKANDFFKKISPEGKMLILSAKFNREAKLSFGNLSKVKLAEAVNVDIVNCLKYPLLLIERDALPILARRLLGNASG